MTGAGGGIGLSIVKLLLKDPRVALVVAVDLQTLDLENLRVEHNSRLHVVKGDVSQLQTNQDAVTAAAQRTGRLDAIILNAGVLGPISSIADGNVDAWKKLFDVNFFGPLHGVSHHFSHRSQHYFSMSYGSNRFRRQFHIFVPPVVVSYSPHPGCHFA